MDRREFLVRSAAGFALAGSSGANVFAQPLTAVTWRFNWTWVGNYAPVVYGRELGFYKEQGLDLAIGQGKGSGATVRQAGAKNDMFVWADTSALLVAASQGVPIKAVMVIAKSNLGVLWLEDRLTIKSARDLIGKKVSATPGDGNTQMWPAVLAANNMQPGDVELVYMDGSAAVAALRAGKVDASFGGASDQPVTLRNAGFKAKCLTFAELGVPTLGSGVITHVDTIKEKPDLVRRVVAATQKSWEAGLKNPEAAVAALMKISETPLNQNVLRGGLEVFQSLATGTRPVGYVDPAAMQQTLDILKQYGNVKTDLPATAFYMNDFVGGA